MNIQALTDAVAYDADISKADARAAVDAVIAHIVTGMADSGEVAIPGFGKFTVKDYPARTGNNPRTGEPIEIAAQRKVKFRPAKALRDVIAEALLSPDPAKALRDALAAQRKRA